MARALQSRRLNATQHHHYGDDHDDDHDSDCYVAQLPLYIAEFIPDSSHQSAATNGAPINSRCKHSAMHHNSDQHCDCSCVSSQVLHRRRRRLLSASHRARRHVQPSHNTCRSSPPSSPHGASARRTAQLWRALHSGLR